jgi:hypothetical protein
MKTVESLGEGRRPPGRGWNLKDVRRVTYRGNQFHEISFIKLVTVVSQKKTIVLNWMLHTESNVTVVTQLLFNVTISSPI